jgi:hypothetical protein
MNESTHYQSDSHLEMGSPKISRLYGRCGCIDTTYSARGSHSGTLTAWYCKHARVSLLSQGKEFRIQMFRAQPHNAACQSQRSGSYPLTCLSARLQLVFSLVCQPHWFARTMSFRAWLSYEHQYLSWYRMRGPRARSPLRPVNTS